MTRAGKKEDSRLVAKVKTLAALLIDRNLTEAQRIIGAVMLTHFHNTGSGDCYPSIRQLAKLTGKGKATVIRAIDALEGRYFDSERSNGGCNNRNRYAFRMVPPARPLDEGNGLTSETRNGLASETRNNPVNHPKEQVEESASPIESGDTLRRAPDGASPRVGKERLPTFFDEDEEIPF